MIQKPILKYSENSMVIFTGIDLDRRLSTLREMLTNDKLIIIKYVQEDQYEKS